MRTWLVSQWAPSAEVEQVGWNLASSATYKTWFKTQRFHFGPETTSATWWADSQRERGMEEPLSNHVTTMRGFVLERTTKITDVDIQWYTYYCTEWTWAFKNANCGKRYYKSCQAWKPWTVFVLFHHCNSIIPPKIPSNKYGIEGFKQTFLLEWMVVPKQFSQEGLIGTRVPHVHDSNVVMFRKQINHPHQPLGPPCNTGTHRLFCHPGTSTSAPGNGIDF
jgi:hypothetical protein